MIKSDSLIDNFYATQKTFRIRNATEITTKIYRSQNQKEFNNKFNTNFNWFYLPKKKDLILTFWCNHAICHKLIKNRLQNFLTGRVFFYAVCNGTKLSFDIISNWVITVFENLQKSLILQHCERSELCLHFGLKVKQCYQMVNFR